MPAILRKKTSASVPARISDRQFFQALAVRGDITEAEALAAVKTGEIPAQMQTLIDNGVPDTARFAATMMIAGATTFERDHPMTALLGQLYGWNDEAIDDVFRFAATL